MMRSQVVVRALERAFSARNDVNRKGFLVQSVLDETRELGVVFDQEELHD